MNPAIILFEVIDKEPSISRFLSIFLSIAAVGFFMCLYRHWLLILVIPIVLVVGLILTSELRDPHVGPAIAAESKSHIIQVYLGFSIAIVAPCIGAIIRKQPDRRQ